VIRSLLSSFQNIPKRAIDRGVTPLTLLKITLPRTAGFEQRVLQVVLGSL